MYMTNPRNHFGLVKDMEEIRGSQQGFIKGKSCLTILISFYGKTGLVDEGRPILIVYLDFKRIVSTISHYILHRQAVDA